MKKNSENTKLHLLEPYRSGLLTAAYKEGLIHVSPKEAASQMPTLNMPPDISTSALQLMVLFDDVSIVWADTAKEVAQKPVPNVKASGLRSSGIADLVMYRSPGVFQSLDWTYSQRWESQKGEISVYEPLILAQLEATNQSIPYVLFKLLEAHRTKKSRKIVDLYANSVPRHLQKYAKMILEDDPLAVQFDFPVFARLGEIRFAHKLMSQDGRKLAVSVKPGEKGYSNDIVGDAEERVFQLVVEELLQEKLYFPIPEKLSDVGKLRNLPEITDFRQFLLPWFQELINGATNEEERLRKEVKKCVAAFRRAPVAGRILNIIGWCSLPLGIAETLTGVIGPGIVTSVISFGCGRLTKRWKKLGGWVSIAA